MLKKRFAANLDHQLYFTYYTFVYLSYHFTLIRNLYAQQKQQSMRLYRIKAGGTCHAKVAILEQERKIITIFVIHVMK
jgi:hypothetical protein